MLESEQPSALAVYERGLEASERATEPVRFDAVGDDGSRRRLPLSRWLEAPGRGERELLRRAVGPVLDVGCGAGRHVVALRRQGVEAVGIEVSPHVTALARERGGVVIEGSIFEARLPSIWNTALLLDGNIGIGGDPRGLLRRVAGLLRGGGAVLVEVEPPATVSRTSRVRLESSREVSDWIPWTFVAGDEIEAIAAAAGLRLDELWQTEGRWFARLLREGRAWPR